MSNFIKESVEELEHVVWPTQAESKKYMYYTVGVIITIAAMLAVLGYVIQQGLRWARAQFPHTPITTAVSVSGEDLATESDLQALTDAIAKKKATASGVTATGNIIQTGTGK